MIASSVAASFPPVSTTPLSVTPVSLPVSVTPVSFTPVSVPPSSSSSPPLQPNVRSGSASRARSRWRIAQNLTRTYAPSKSAAALLDDRLNQRPRFLVEIHEFDANALRILAVGRIHANDPSQAFDQLRSIFQGKL